MKVLQIVKTSDGAAWAFEQAKELKERGIDIVTILPNETGKIVIKYKNNNMKIIIGDFSLPIKKPWLFFSRKKKLLKILEEEKPDLIHFHFVTNIIFGRLALRNNRIPRLFQVPGPLHLENKLIRKIEIKLANNFDYWAPACIFSKKIYEKNVDINHVFLAYYGGYGGESTKQYSITNKLHKEYNIEKSKKIVGMVSYFYKPKYYLGQTRGIKGHEDFIDAIKILNRKRNDIIAIVVGGPWEKSFKYMQKVKRYAKNKDVNNIIFTGFRDDVKDIYKEFDVAVHPSHSENLGGAAESLAAGVPTVSTNVGGFPDIVINNKTGLLCFPNNPVSLAESIDKMLNDTDARKLALNGQRKVKEMLDIKKTAQVIYTIYCDIVKGKII